MIEEWKLKDPIARFEKILLNDRVLNETNMKEIGQKIAVAIEEAVKVALEAPYPEPAEASHGVYAPAAGSTGSAAQQSPGDR